MKKHRNEVRKKKTQKNKETRRKEEGKKGRKEI